MNRNPKSMRFFNLGDGSVFGGEPMTDFDSRAPYAPIRRKPRHKLTGLQVFFIGCAAGVALSMWVMM